MIRLIKYLKIGGEMMSKTYNSFEEALDDLFKDVKGAMVIDVKDKSEKTLHEYSERIGEMYTEKTWEDRYDRNPNDENAFENEHNIITDIVEDKNEITLNTHNIAKGEIYDKDIFLDEIIETGKGYEYGNPPPRPVVQMTQEDMDEKLESIINNSLKRKGWDIK